MVNKWYVLHVKTGLELDIAKKLRSRGFTATVPIESRMIRKGGKWTQQKYIVFAGYVFLYMNYELSKYHVLKGLCGGIKSLGGGKSPTYLKNPQFLNLRTIILMKSLAVFSLSTRIKSLRLNADTKKQP